MALKQTDAHLLTTPEAARRLSVAIGTLQNWRTRGEGSAFVGSLHQLEEPLKHRPAYGKGSTHKE